MPPENEINKCMDCHVYDSKFNQVNKRLDKLDDAIISIADSLKTLAVLDNNSQRFENTINGLRDKLQHIDKTIAERPTVHNLEKIDEKVGKLFGKLDTVENKVTALESSRSTLGWIIGVLVTLVAAYIATL